ncbi:MAG: hypothetical protein VW274_00870 [Thalassolituus sp.]
MATALATPEKEQLTSAPVTTVQTGSVRTDFYDLIGTMVLERKRQRNDIVTPVK